MDSSTAQIYGQKDIVSKIKILNEDYAKQVNYNYDEIFYLLEINDSGFINREFMETHDLCDIPGLSEFQITEDNKIENKIKTTEKTDTSRMVKHLT